MKPFRIKMAHQLILNYGLYRHMNIYKPHLATDNEMSYFHNPDYIEFIKKISPAAVKDIQIDNSGAKYNIGETDCPVFEGLYNFGQISAGGSIDAAIKLNHGKSDICINWAGGLHHAKKSEASGFCYINDIVLGILELLKCHNRVLYVDIDVHHGDGVEEAFYTTNRVMTMSLHKYGDFFPGTGSLKDIGHDMGKFYALNVPLRSGMDDEGYTSIFKILIEQVINKYRPGAIVMQCGADSLAYDRLGPLNLTLNGHGECVNIVKKLGLPLLILGGGGYTIKNVSRCWTYETSLILGRPVENEIPPNDYYEYYAPYYKLHLTVIA